MSPGEREGEGGWPRGDSTSRQAGRHEWERVRAIIMLAGFLFPLGATSGRRSAIRADLARRRPTSERKAGDSVSVWASPSPLFAGRRYWFRF